MKRHSWTTGTIWETSSVFKLGPLGVWSGDSWTPDYFREECSSSDCRAECRGVPPGPCSVEPWHPGPALHMDVIIGQGQGWSEQGGAGRFSGQRKSSFPFWHKTLLTLVLCTVITSRFSARRRFQEGQQEGCSLSSVP